jgi:ankyrin repeat protein
MPGFAALFLMLTSLSAASDLFQSIRSNDCAAVKRLVSTREAANSRNQNGATALMYAALHADINCMKHLFNSGADPNAANPAGATPLIWAAGDLEKVKLLVAHGADIKARSKEGRSAIHVAARQVGTIEVVRFLLDKGADPNDKDNFQGTPLLMAAEAGDLSTVKLLVDRGADVHHRAHPAYGAPRFSKLEPGFVKAKPAGDFGGMSALMAGVIGGSKEVVQFLLAKGAKPNQTFIGNSSPLIAAVQSSDPEMVRILLEAGADAKVREYREATPLILAASSDDTTPAMIKLLLDHGVDRNAKDARGKTALDWALTRGVSPTASALGAKPNDAVVMNATVSKAAPDAVRQAVDRSLDLLLKSSREFFKQSGCISCHNQSLAQVAIATARRRGFTVNEELAGYQNKAVLSVITPHRETMLQGVPTVPASTIVSTYTLIGMAAEGLPASDVTDALVHELAQRQRADGSWRGFGDRPPLEQGDITGTTLTLRALQLYPLPGRKREFDRRIAAARAWLAKAQGTTNQEKTMKLLGLAWTQADPAATREAARRLAADQRADGGWGQLATLESDAYATGQALFALHEGGALKPSDPAYQRGVAFLLSTQKADGSWHVKSRALGFQPYFESGYPHGHDQWISAAGAAWATTALALTVEPGRTMAASR